MIRKIVNTKDPVLRQKAKEVPQVDKKIQSLIKDLKETLAAQTDPEGIGLAAPQIGKSLRLFIIRFESLNRVVINPKIIKVSGTPKKPNDKDPLEGCLSLPHYYGPLVRPRKIKISYLDENGKSVVEQFRGFPAQIIQHEIDHLEGIIFIDRVIEQGTKLFKHKSGEWEEVDLV